MNQWLYLGIYQRSGHYLFLEGMRIYPFADKTRNLSRFDNILPPQDSIDPYIATVSRLDGWGRTALAFWDYSVDERMGSNSVIFAPSLTITPEELLGEANRRFPQVFGRLPQAVRLKTPSAI